MIRVVLDNLTAHTGAALDEAYEPAEARRTLDRLAVHYTPTHGSWLNQMEVETLAWEMAAGEAPRHAATATVEW